MDTITIFRTHILSLVFGRVSELMPQVHEGTSVAPHQVVAMINPPALLIVFKVLLWYVPHSLWGFY